MAKTEITNIPYKEIIQLILAVNGPLIKNTFINGKDMKYQTF